ncbi:glycosyl transferase, partial [Enterococcus casseliflavus]
YSWDNDIYDSTRGLYFDEKELPGPILSTIDEVIESINAIESVKAEYKENYNRAKENFVKYEDGWATKRVINYIFKDQAAGSGKVVKLTNTKEKVLIYTGGMQNNGITSSLLNLLKNIDYDRYEVTCFMGNPNTKEKLENVNRIPKQCHLIFKPGYAILTPEESKNLRKITSQNNVDRIDSSMLPWEGFRREANRIFSNSKFDVAIDFSGYSFYWAKYILSSDSKKKICYMHSDMDADRQKIVNGRQVHFKTLGQLF